MSKTNTKKMLTVMISIAMVFSALAILSFAATPAFATATGTVTYNPTTFGESLSGSTYTMTPTYVTANGGTFNSGSTVYFYISSTTSASGVNTGSLTAALPFGEASIGSVTLSGGSTTLSNTVVKLFTSVSGTHDYSGTWYILASDGATFSVNNQFTVAGQITVVTSQPSIEVYLSDGATQAVGSNALNVGGTGIVKGTGFDSGASVTVYLSYAGGTTLVTTTASNTGSIKASFTVPAVSGTVDTSGNVIASGSYNVIALETNTLSGSYSVGGVTADSTMDVGPAVTVAPASTNGNSGSVFTITGSGFVAGETIAASTISSVSDSIKIGTTYVYNSLVTVGSDGSFTVSVTTISALSSTGPVSVVIVTGSPTQTDTFTDAVYVSVPNTAALGFSFYDAYSASSTAGQPNDSPVYATVWNFPAGTSVTVALGGVTLGTVTTDSNGYGVLTTSIPAMSYGQYTPTASTSSGFYKQTSAFYVNSLYYVNDSAGNTMTTSTPFEYVPYDGSLTVVAYGLSPLQTYTVTDTGTGGDVISNGVVVSLNVGSYNSASTAFYPALNGTLIFTYQPYYASSYSSSITTGTSKLAEFTSGDVYSSGTTTDTATSNTAIADYKEIGGAGVSVSTATTRTQGTIYSATSSQSVTAALSNLIPIGSTVYPTESTSYSLYLDSSLVSVSLSSGGTSSSSFTAGSGGTVTVYFTEPSSSAGMQFVNVTYKGSTGSSYLGSGNLISSTAATSTGLYASYTLKTQSLLIAGFGFVAGESFQLWYMTYTGAVEINSGSITADANGAVSASVSLLHEPAGTYGVFVKRTGYSAVSSVSYTVSPYFKSLGGGYVTYGSSMGTVTAYGLQPSTYYELLLSGTYVDEQLSDSSGTWSYAETVPLIAAGTHSLTLGLASSASTPVVSQSFTVIANSKLVLSTSSQYAFPGQLVQFSASTFTAPPLDLTTTGPTTIEYFAQISLNGTLIATVPASLSSGTLSGSFINPNNAAGSYYYITITGYEQIGSANSALGGSLTSGSIIQAALSGGPVSDFFGLVSGNGALLTGISASEIATLEADINSSVSTSLTVPIAQLNAAITSINGAVATLKTTVGNITTDLSTINATVRSIESGQVTVLTDLGSISTSLASLNASLVAFNNNVVTINTTLGQVVTSLGSIQTQVTANGNGIATVKTAVGTIQGQIVSTNGNVSTIKTSLGTLTTSVGNVSKQTQGFPTLEIFLIVIIVLVLITLVISFLAVSAANKAARRATEEKKQ